jgi:hypothetical protein
MLHDLIVDLISRHLGICAFVDRGNAPQAEQQAHEPAGGIEGWRRALDARAMEG